MTAKLVCVAGLLSILLKAGWAAAAPQFRGLAVGTATREDAVKLLGPPKYGDPAKDEKLVYDALRRQQVDELTFEGPGGTLTVVEAASPLPGLATRADIAASLGEPEYELRLGRQTMLEYSQRGMRFWVDNDRGATIGTALFTPMDYPRVPPGEQRKVTVPAFIAAPAEKAATFRVGFASRDITPPPGVPADTRYTKVHDPLYVRAIVIAAGGKTIAIVGADAFVFTSYEIAPIQEGARAAGIDHLLFASSHSHSAPDGIGLDIPHADQYDAFVQQQAVACIKEAQQALTPATIAVAQAELMLDGAHVALISRNWRDPGLVWPYVTVVRFLAAEKQGQTLGTLVQFVCHPERLARYDNAISADWVAAMRKRVEAALGGMCVFVNGALGGMVSPDEVPGSDRFADTQRIGDWIGNALVATATGKAMTLARGNLDFRVRPLLIPMTSEKIAARMEQGWIKGTLIRGAHQTWVGRLDIGELQIIAIPGELLPDLGFRARSHMTGKCNLIVGLANDEIGYIVPAWDYLIGQYEETTGMGPSTAPQIMCAIEDLLRSP
jgi:hypothetical protein